MAVIRGVLAIVPRILQLVFTIVIISLVGHILATSYWNYIPRGRGNAAELNFAMFLGIFALVTLPVLALFDWKSPESRLILLAIAIGDVINMLLHLGGAIGLTAAMEIHDCGNRRYNRTNRITRDARDKEGRCREAQAATAFIWFNLLLFIATSVLSSLGILRPRARIDRHEKTLSHSGHSRPGTASTMNAHYSTGPEHSVHTVHPAHSVHSVHPAVSAQPAGTMKKQSSIGSLSKKSSWEHESVSSPGTEGSTTLAWIPEEPAQFDKPHDLSHGKGRKV